MLSAAQAAQGRTDIPRPGSDGLVCLAFVIFYIPDFLRGSGADAASGDTIASVEGRAVTAAPPRP